MSTTALRGSGHPALAIPAEECDGSNVLDHTRSNVLEMLRPGSFVKLHNQPADLPPFQLIHCRGGRCWVRQQSWGQLVHWEVSHRQLTRAA